MLHRRHSRSATAKAMHMSDCISAYKTPWSKQFLIATRSRIEFGVTYREQSTVTISNSNKNRCFPDSRCVGQSAVISDEISASLLPSGLFLCPVIEMAASSRGSSPLLREASMLGTSFVYFLKHPTRLVKAITADPRESWIKFEDRYYERLERKKPIFQYQADPQWEQRLHALLGVPWPCEVASQFLPLWREVITELEATGVRAGPMSFGSWNDGDAGLVRSIWCLMHHCKAHNVIETGVGHGVTSRFVLEALHRNSGGHLWSIDLPSIDPALRAQVGTAVGKRFEENWTYIEGSSRRRLPALLAKQNQIDIFIHDSLHSERNVLFELDRAWPLLRPGGAIVVDDIDANGGFHTFAAKFPSCPSMICEAEPLHPDLRRFNQKGLFGIILKTPDRGH